MKMKKRAVAILVLPAVSLLLSARASLACEGPDLDETNRLYQHMEFVGRTCNEAGSVQDSVNCLQEEWGYTAQKMSKLPESCREMLKEFEPEAE